MFKDYWKYEWVLPVYRCEGPLLATLAEKVIAPAEGKVQALAERRRMIEAELTKPQKPHLRGSSPHPRRGAAGRGEHGQVPELPGR